MKLIKDLVINFWMSLWCNPRLNVSRGSLTVSASHVLSQEWSTVSAVELGYCWLGCWSMFLWRHFIFIKCHWLAQFALNEYLMERKTWKDITQANTKTVMKRATSEWLLAWMDHLGSRNWRMCSLWVSSFSQWSVATLQGSLSAIFRLRKSSTLLSWTFGCSETSFLNTSIY